MSVRVNSLSNDEQQAWHEYLRAHSLAIEAVNRALMANYRISLHEYDVLSHLSKASGHRLRMTTLADLLTHSRARTSQTVSRLERRGLVHRSISADDARGINATITGSGLALLRAATPIFASLVHAYLVDKLGRIEFQRLETPGAPLSRAGSEFHQGF